MSVILPQSLQEGIQTSLPIIPNNGNPGGANNMPAAEQEQAAQPPDPYAWLQPSPFMADIGTMLKQQSEYVDRLWEQMNNPQDQNKFNPVVRDGQWHYMPLNDFGLPLGSNAPTWPMVNELEESPQRLPVLPGE